MPSRTGSLFAGGEPKSVAIHPRADLAGEVDLETPLHLAIGMFDGVHVGHQLVIGQAMAAASKVDGHASGVLTFDPHPSRVIHPSAFTELLLPLERRIYQMHELGVDCVFVQTFTQEFGKREAEDFVPGLLKVFPNLKSLHVGENFRFGARRSGGIDTLRTTAEAAGVELHAVPRERFGGDPISSSRIRKELTNGGIKEASLMLGRPYVIEGVVTSGKRIGRELGFPTLNIPWSPEVLPQFGVYRVWLKLVGSETALKGIANYGVRPTVEGAKIPLLEVHLLESAEFPIEGERVRVALEEFLREEREFPSVAALREQISKDVDQARNTPSGVDEIAIPRF